MRTSIIPGILALLAMAVAASSAETYPGDKERKAKMSPEELAWEKLLEQNLGSFYLPRYKEAKVKGRETAWDFVKDDPNLPRVLLIDGKEVVRAGSEKLVGAGSLGFYVWNSGKFDNLKVYRLPQAAEARH